MAYENDLGNRKPFGFAFTGGNNSFKIIQKLAVDYLGAFNSTFIQNGDGTMTDTEPLQALGIPVMRNLIEDGPNDEKYYTYHHSAGDSVSLLDPDWMDDNVGALASLFYLVADMDESLPKD